MAGQFCFCGDVRRGVDAGVGEDFRGGLLGCVGGVLFVVDGDAGEQGAVEGASFGWFALAVEVVEVDQEIGELVQACSGLGVGVGEVVESGGDLVEAGADAVLFAFEEVEWYRVGVVGLDEFEAFGFELVALGGQELAFVLAGSFELIEHVVEDLSDVLRLGVAEGVALVGAFDLGFGGIGRVAAELGVNKETLRVWVRKYKASGRSTPAESIDFETENRRLRAELAEAKRANEILRRASAFFAAELDHPSK
ncbi:transposase [Brevibacterium ravenspurgense]|uniref:transposase n=1 Tax=Brevibacterium ravenspurgense TaxID=479117 RepID=UPI003CC7F3F4